MNQKADQRKKSSNIFWEEAKTRERLALWITIFSLLGIVILSIVIIVTDKKEQGQAVLNSVLPLFGTWVGTVMAYFFSRENFESASRNFERMSKYLTSQEKLESIPVNSVMTHRNLMIVCDEPENTNLLAILTELEKRDLQRLPILNKKPGAPIALLFTKDIGTYLFRDNLDKTDAERKSLTVKDMLEKKPEYKQPYAIIAENQTLADAQEKLSKVPNSRVVLVTKGGKDDDEVVGLLTLVDIVRNAQV